MAHRLHGGKDDHTSVLRDVRRNDDAFQTHAHVQRVVEDLVGQLRLVPDLLRERVAHVRQQVHLRVVRLQILSRRHALLTALRIEQAPLRARYATDRNHVLSSVGGVLRLQLTVALENLLQVVLHLLYARLRVVRSLKRSPFASAESSGSSLEGTAPSSTRCPSCCAT